jgi:hypothetical protein
LPVRLVIEEEAWFRDLIFKALKRRGIGEKSPAAATGCF